MTILSGAMEPTLTIDQRIEVDPIDGDEIARGDVVVLELPDSDAGGITTFVGVLDGRLTIDGEPLEEPWLPAGVTTPPFSADGECSPSCLVGEDEVFVLGDNRMNSAASNLVGPMPTDAVVGRVRLDED
jgi:signal peptidase I